jgi:hypothetical protein
MRKLFSTGRPERKQDGEPPATAGSRASRPRHRWLRKNASEVITLDDALEIVAAGSAESPAVIDQRRLASEMRARSLEDMVLQLKAQLQSLESTLQIVTERSRYFERSYERLRSQSGGSPAPQRPGKDRPAESGDDRTAALFRKVGLAADCPTYVLEAARRAFAREFHPDRHATAAEKEKASVEFQYYMRIFEVIMRAREKK